MERVEVSCPSLRCQGEIPSVKISADAIREEDCLQPFILNVHGYSTRKLEVCLLDMQNRGSCGFSQATCKKHNQDNST